MIPVKNHFGLYRDENTNAILNDSDYIYNEYMASKNKLIQNQKKLKLIEKELEDIKQILNSILQNK